MLLLGSAQLIRANTDLLLVGSMLGRRSSASIPRRFAPQRWSRFFLTVSSVVAQPRMAEMHAQGRKADLRRFVHSSTRMTLIVSLAIGVVLVLLGKPVLELFGTGFVRGYPVLLALIAGHVLAAASGPLTSLLMMCGHHQRAATLHVASMLTNAALVAWLTPRYGILGAAVATSANLALTQLALRADRAARVALGKPHASSQRSQ
jgi:O-antigen/teichoic acid export membrane protein